MRKLETIGAGLILIALVFTIMTLITYFMLGVWHYVPECISLFLIGLMMSFAIIHSKRSASTTRKALLFFVGAIMLSELAWIVLDVAPFLFYFWECILVLSVLNLSLTLGYVVGGGVLWREKA